MIVKIRGNIWECVDFCVLLQQTLIMPRIWINVIMTDLIKILILVVVIPCFVIFLLKGLKHWKFWSGLCEKTNNLADVFLWILLYVLLLYLSLFLFEKMGLLGW